MRNKLKQNYLLIILIIVQTIIYIIAGSYKQYLHIDEAYSYGLTNYERIEIQDNEDFYNNWHKKEYYNDYLTIQEDERGKYKPIYENQKNDVHPPLYYLILRIAMGFTDSQFSKWTGIGVNIIIYAFITIFMYLILRKLLKEEEKPKEKAVILAFMSSVTLASISNAIYIRMYALSALNILITTFLHIKLLEQNKPSKKILVGIGTSALFGVLTHYYYLFYLVVLYIIFAVKYIKQKEIKILINYTLTMAIAGITSLIIFPYSIQHMFFGYRGQGVISKFGNIQEILGSIYPNIYNLNYYAFNNLMYIIVVIVVALLIYNKVRKHNKNYINSDSREILKIIFVPSLIFFIIAGLASPWQVLRYIVPVCGLIFVVVMYYLYKLLKTITSQKMSDVIICVVFCLTLIMPIAFKMEPELLYVDNKEIIQKLSGELNLPTIYMYHFDGGCFLEDIFLFSKIEESYIAKEIEYTEENIQEIVKDKDISNGIVIFITEGRNDEEILQVIKNVTKLNKSEHLKKLNTCNVYYVR